MVNQCILIVLNDHIGQHASSHFEGIRGNVTQKMLHESSYFGRISTILFDFLKKVNILEHHTQKRNSYFALAIFRQIPKKT